MSGIACAELYTPLEFRRNVLVEFDGDRLGRIRERGQASLPAGYYDATQQGVRVLPGLVDAHVHGCGGSDFLDRTQEAFDTVSRTAARGGTTTIGAVTTIPVEDADLAGFETFVHEFRAARPPGARFAGVYLEGPFLNMERRGGYGPRYIQPVDLEKAARILELAGDDLVKITIAPEIDGGEDLLRLVCEHSSSRAEVCLGHTAASYEQAAWCFAHARARGVTHLFNAMVGIHHRSPGVACAALLDDNVTVEVIADGVHLEAPILQMVYRLKGPRRMAVITDATAATGTPPGTCLEDVGGMIEYRDGAIRLPDGTLAGSPQLMAEALLKAQELTGTSFIEALEMCTLTPARYLRREAEIGSVETGKRADLCVLDVDGSVRATIRDGIVVYGGGTA